MKTTEVFVEQVLIGFLVMLIGALPFLGVVLPQMDGPLKTVGTAIGAVGAAYLLGIPFDRFADSILSSLEKRKRLIFSREIPLTGPGDPYPEDILKIAVLQASSGTVAWLDYLRSRTRLTRAVAVFAPGLTLSSMLATWPESGQAWDHSPAPLQATAATLAASCAIYAAALACALSAEKSLPRTDELRARIFAGKPFPALCWTKDPVPWFLLPFVAVGIFLAMASQNIVCILVGVGGLLLTLLSGWSWWRITETYMKFLANYGRWKLIEEAKGAGS